eukprot:m.31687 g.31687  ORF g.31687 m.31687 type:complete len:66 (+) comp9452_c0_seq2:1130-1327(+)
MSGFEPGCDLARKTGLRAAKLRPTRSASYSSTSSCSMEHLQSQPNSQIQRAIRAVYRHQTTSMGV